MKLYKRSTPIGFYVYSCCGCGDDSAISFSHLEDNKEITIFNVSPEEAIEIANLIIEVAKEYQNGIETGVDYGD